MREIPIYKLGEVFTHAQVDDADYVYLSKRRWHLLRNGYARQDSRGATKRNESSLMHRMITGFPPNGLWVDHINGDKLDNQRCNLRFVTRSINAINIHSARCTSKTGVPGLSYAPNYQGKQPWRFIMRVHGKIEVDKRFTDFGEAKAYALAKRAEIVERETANAPTN